MNGVGRLQIAAGCAAAIASAALAAWPAGGEEAGWATTPAVAGPLRYGGPVAPPPFLYSPPGFPPSHAAPGYGGGSRARGAGGGRFRVDFSVDLDGGLGAWMPWNWRFWR
jgi:hypothetical protein